MPGQGDIQEVESLGLELIQGVKEYQQGLIRGGQTETPGKYLAQSLIGGQLLVVLPLLKEGLQVSIVGPGDLFTDLPEQQVWVGGGRGGADEPEDDYTWKSPGGSGLLHDLGHQAGLAGAGGAQHCQGFAAPSLQVRRDVPPGLLLASEEPGEPLGEILLKLSLPGQFIRGGNLRQFLVDH